MKCTIQSIADELELSRNTVARVLSGKDGVSAKTRKLVLKKAEEMGYGLAAAPLPKKQLPQLPESVVFLTTSSAGSPEARAAVIEAVEEYIQKYNYHLILAVIEQENTFKKEPKLPAVLYSPSVRGICMMDILEESVYQAVLQLNLPTAAVFSSDPSQEYISFTESLRDRIDIISAVSGHCLSRLKKHSTHYVQNQSDLALLLKRDILPDLFICEDDWTAIHLIQTAQMAGYSVPEDFSVIGCGNIPESAHVFPSLTTIQIPWGQIGKAAARCITDRIRDPELSCVSASFAAKLITRNSVSASILN